MLKTCLEVLWLLEHSRNSISLEKCMVFQFTCRPNQRILWVHFSPLLSSCNQRKTNFPRQEFSIDFQIVENQVADSQGAFFFTRLANCDKHMPNGVGDIRRHDFWLRVQKWLVQDLWALARKIRPLNQAFLDTFPKTTMDWVLKSAVFFVFHLRF